MQCNQHLAPPCFQRFQLPALSWAHGRICFRFLRGFWKASYWRHVRRKFYVKSPNQESYLSYLTKTPFQVLDILMPLHTESDSCDRSGRSRNIFVQKTVLNTFRFCVLPWRKNFLTLFGDHIFCIFHLVTMKIFQSPVGACLIKVISDPA